MRSSERISSSFSLVKLQELRAFQAQLRSDMRALPTLLLCFATVVARRGMLDIVAGGCSQATQRRLPASV